MYIYIRVHIPIHVYIYPYTCLRTTLTLFPVLTPFKDSLTILVITIKNSFVPISSYRTICRPYIMNAISFERQLYKYRKLKMADLNDYISEAFWYVFTVIIVIITCIIYLMDIYTHSTCIYNHISITILMLIYIMKI
jgi:hypothetical protein